MKLLKDVANGLIALLRKTRYRPDCAFRCAHYCVTIPCICVLFCVTVPCPAHAWTHAL